MLNEPGSETPSLESFAAYHVERLACPRLSRWLPPEEHLQCLYCHGCEADVQTGLHRRFCGFVPGRDPVHFGFPADGVRDRRG